MSEDFVFEELDQGAMEREICAGPKGSRWYRWTLPEGTVKVVTVAVALSSEDAVQPGRELVAVVMGLGKKLQDPAVLAALKEKLSLIPDGGDLVAELSDALTSLAERTAPVVGVQKLTSHSVKFWPGYRTIKVIQSQVVPELIPTTEVVGR